MFTKNKTEFKAAENETKSNLTLGKLLYAIREAAEISRADFADRLGMTTECLSDIERGLRSIGPKLAADFADKLGYSKEQFIRLSIQDRFN